MKRGVVPFHVVLSSQLFELAEGFLGKMVTRFLVIRVTIVNPAPQGPGLAGSTKVVFLERAEVRRDRLLIRRSVGEKDLRFEVAKEENVAILLESATSAAGHAHRPRSGDGLVHLLIEFQHLAVNLLRHLKTFS
jgi:hypothetical protein